MKISHKISAISIAAMLLISIVFIYLSFRSYEDTIAAQEEINQYADILWEQRPKNLFKDMLVEGKASYVLDMATGKALFQKNADETLPLASITKVMTALIAREKGSDSQIVTISAQALATDGESGLVEGERWALKDLISYTLLVSSNDGSAAIAEAIGGSQQGFVDMMNRKAQDLGLTTLQFTNPSGLDTADYRNTGGKGSAKDVAKLFAYAYQNHPDMFVATSYGSMTYHSESFVHNGTNTNTLVGKIPAISASKTGYTLLAGGNLGVVVEARQGRPIVIIVLGSSFDGRFSDVSSLASTTMQTYNRGQ